MKKLSLILASLALTACSSQDQVKEWNTIDNKEYAKLADLDKDGVILARDLCNYTKDGRRVDNSGCSEVKDQLLKQDYEVQFEADSYELEHKERERFVRFLRKLPADQKWYFKLEGIATNEADILYDQVKSQRRMAYLKSLIESQNVTLAAPVHSKVFIDSQVYEGDGLLANLEDADLDLVPNHLDKCDDTPSHFYVDEMGCPILEERHVDYSLTVRFEHDSADIQPVYLDRLTELANFINNYNVQRIVVNGHTSALGSDSYNMRLSKRRAESIKAMLISDYEIEPAKINTVAKGETELLEQGDSEEVHMLNRRVDISLSEVLTIERVREVNEDDIVDARNVFIQAESTESLTADKWHIFIMDERPQIAPEEGPQNVIGW
ncbi:OmpA family protein [Catenovulum sp. SM1970]|uniref:OmpA family protein n=1 Tax=Marinifaba aquimaris TaxID=2741323 RepID=UPI0015748C12|nr:OmpA family protein [Marinifaba aquimaris]NTS75629.1 OmpA family protein [Marinifaba aquimaris]